MEERDAGNEYGILTVISSVFDGLLGWVSGGRLERSSLRELREEDRDLVAGLEGSDKLELLEAADSGLSLGLSIVCCLKCFGFV